MTTIERKQLLLQRLFAVNDEQKLEAIETFMNRHCPDNVLYFSDELKEEIDASIEQMRQGQTYTTSEMEKRMEKWIGK